VGLAVRCFLNILRFAQKWVREAAVWATAYSPWPQYRPLLKATAQSDPEENLRRDAFAVLAGFDAHRVEAL
jgi:hypothetical protein